MFSYFCVDEGKLLVTKWCFEEFNDVFFAAERKMSCFETKAAKTPRGGGGYWIYPWVGRCGSAPHTLTLFKTKEYPPPRAKTFQALIVLYGQESYVFKRGFMFA